MLAIKQWLQTTGLSVAEEAFSAPPALPYIVFNESVNVGGADAQNLTAERMVSIELYSAKITSAAEQSIETLLNAKAFHYTKDRIWIGTDLFFQTIYDFTLTEKL